MGYFDYTFNGIKYVFKPTRQAQVTIEKIQKERRQKCPHLTEEIVKLEKKIRNAQMANEKASKAVEEAKEALETAKKGKDEEKIKVATVALETEEEKAQLVLDDLMEITTKAQEVQDMVDFDGFPNEREQIMYILLAEQRDLFSGEKVYPNLSKEIFDQLCNAIYEEYGSQEYAEICEAIVEDVFTLADQANEKKQPKSAFLQNRKKK